MIGWSTASILYGDSIDGVNGFLGRTTVHSYSRGKGDLSALSRFRTKFAPGGYKFDVKSPPAYLIVKSPPAYFNYLQKKPGNAEKPIRLQSLRKWAERNAAQKVL